MIDCKNDCPKKDGIWVPQIVRDCYPCLKKQVAEQNSVIEDLESWRNYWHRVAESNGKEAGSLKAGTETLLIALEKTADFFARNNMPKLAFWPDRIKEYWFDRMMETNQ